MSVPEVADLSFLSGLADLRVLELRLEKDVTDLNVLAGLGKLRFLKLMRNGKEVGIADSSDENALGTFWN